MHECIDEAFWNRSLPSAFVSGSLGLWAVKSGRINPKSRFVAFPIVLGFGSLGYMFGKFSFIASDKCMDIFLKRAPTSIISENVRIRREAEGGWDSNLPNRFMDVLDHLDDSKISNKENQILEDCNTVAFWRYSLPISAGLAGSIYLAVKSKVLKESRYLTSFPYLPKMVFGSCLGYIIGQYLYVKSADCPRRIQKYDPEGHIAGLLRGEVPPATEEEGYCQGCQSEQVFYGETEEYVLPQTDASADLELGLRQAWDNKLDKSFVP